MPGSDGYRPGNRTAEAEELLPVTYFHVVFTLPHGLNPLIQCNEALGYDLLFKAAAQSVKELCEDKKYLGATPGMMSILHTWGQNLMYHPHIHSVPLRVLFLLADLPKMATGSKAEMDSFCQLR